MIILEENLYNFAINIFLLHFFNFKPVTMNAQSSSLPEVLILGNMEHTAHENPIPLLSKLCCVFFLFLNTYSFLPPLDFKVGVLFNISVPLKFVFPISGFFFLLSIL